MTTKRSNRLMNVAAGVAALAAVASATLAWGPATATGPATTPAGSTTPSTVPAIADPAVSGTDLVPWGSADSFQMQMQRENLVFTSVSNVLKARHETSKNSIQNVR